MEAHVWTSSQCLRNEIDFDVDNDDDDDNKDNVVMTVAFGYYTTVREK